MKPPANFNLLSLCLTVKQHHWPQNAGGKNRPFTPTPNPQWIRTGTRRLGPTSSFIVNLWLFHRQHAPALKADASPHSSPVMASSVRAGYAQPGLTEDDILLELVMFVGVVCDDATAPQLVQTCLVSLLLCVIQQTTAVLAYICSIVCLQLLRLEGIAACTHGKHIILFDIFASTSYRVFV